MLKLKVYRDRSIDELIAQMATQSQRCLGITETEMKAVLKAGGKVSSVQELKRLHDHTFWVEIETQHGFFFADCHTDPRF